METHEPIRILIVDDSRIFRGLLQSVLEQIPGVVVVGSVFNGEKGLEFIDKSPPDLITLDIEMPGMSGLDTLRAIAKRNESRRPSPAIATLLVSSLTKTGSMVAVEGLQLGAFDFVCKPSESSESANREALRRSLIEKLNAFRASRLSRRTHFLCHPAPPQTANLAPRQTAGKFAVIAIGTSTGGPEALGCMLPNLVARCSAPIFIVQHILEGLSQYLAESLSRKCNRKVIEADDDLLVQPGGIYLAKSGRHMLLRSSDGKVRIGTSIAPPEKGCRPSVDIFFRSAAGVYGSTLATAILTGMGDDGSDGIRSVKRSGGYVIAQDESSCVVWGMPRAAVATGFVDEVLPLSKIADRFVALLAEPKS